MLNLGFQKPRICECTEHDVLFLNHTEVEWCVRYDCGL